jgi:hypothetical protein
LGLVAPNQRTLYEYRMVEISSKKKGMVEIEMLHNIDIFVAFLVS